MKPTGKRIRVSRKASFVLTLLFLGVASHTSTAVAQSTGTFTATGNMTRGRIFHTATLLPNNKVLIAGGRGIDINGDLASAELYDPVTGTFAATGDMTMARSGHTATLLPDGRVLIAGGGAGNGPNSAELYDPSTGAFTATGDMIAAQLCHTVTLLGNGKVLIAGGEEPSAVSDPGPASDAELYDPATGTFAATGRYAGPICPTATLLPDGKVLVAEFKWNGGQNNAELYDPATGAFSVTGRQRELHGSATLLMTGEVLLAGGIADIPGPSADVELYASSTGTFAAAGNLTTGRADHTATLLPDGTVLIAGGFGFSCTAGYPQPPSSCVLSGSLASVELYDPSTGAFAATGEMPTHRWLHVATLLNDGKVLITGGVSNGGGIPTFFGSPASASTELYNPPSLVPAPVLFSLSGDGRGQGAILHGGTHQVASPDNPAIVGEALEIYCTGLVDGSVIPPQVAIGGQMAGVLFFGKAPGWASLNQVNVRVPSGVAPGSAVPVRLTYLGRPSNEVTIAVR